MIGLKKPPPLAGTAAALNNNPNAILILIDTNIFVIDPRYKRDVCYKTNRRFLDYIAENEPILLLLLACWNFVGAF